jgi:hypothetical protein
MWGSLQAADPLSSGSSRPEGRLAAKISRPTSQDLALLPDTTLRDTSKYLRMLKQ